MWSDEIYIYLLLAITRSAVTGKISILDDEPEQEPRGEVRGWGPDPEAAGIIAEASKDSHQSAASAAGIPLTSWPVPYYIREGKINITRFMTA